MHTLPLSDKDGDPVVIRLSALGDLVLITGVLDYWNRTRGCRFTVITRSGLESILDHHPAVKNVIALEKSQLAFPQILACFHSLAQRHRGAELVDLHGTLRTRLLSLVWKGPVRRYRKYGLERRLFLKSGGRLFRERLRRINVPQRYALALEETAPSRQELLPRIFLTPAEVEAGRIRLKGLCTEEGGRAPVALHPYATHPDKAWTEAHWRRLVTGLDALGIPWFVVGRGAAMSGLPAERDLTNRTSLRETCALLQASSVLITGDSGPMHLACAVGTPVLALFGPTTSEWGFFPAGKRDRVLEADLPCRPCTLHGQRQCRLEHACMSAITPEQVLDALRDM